MGIDGEGRMWENLGWVWRRGEDSAFRLDGRAYNVKGMNPPVEAAKRIAEREASHYGVAGWFPSAVLYRPSGTRPTGSSGMVSRAASAVSLLLVAGLVSGCSAPAVDDAAPVTSAPPAASGEPLETEAPESEFTDEALAAEGALTVDDSFLVRFTANKIDECRIYYAADLAGVDEGSEGPIADCWALMDDFGQIAEDFSAKLEPWVMNSDGLSEDNTTLVNTSYGAMLTWLGTDIPDGCISEPGAAADDCEEPFFTRMDVSNIWLDRLADQWADEALAG
ncbi:hypothetical protein ACFFGH_10765 [Lysobacter korlensis]|uniref:Uncharacterized protein n=1 Tax=Lysobacter korlensis TaxID=553636 RepID=A0ABV6RMW3_9GAMM